MNDQAYQEFLSHLEEQKKDVLEQLAQLDIDFQDEVRNDEQEAQNGEGEQLVEEKKD